METWHKIKTLHPSKYQRNVEFEVFSLLFGLYLVMGELFCMDEGELTVCQKIHFYFNPKETL